MECTSKTLTPYQLTGAIQLYEATGKEEYKDYVITILDQLEAQEEIVEHLPSQDALAYFFALEQTGDEKYRQKIEVLISKKNWDLDFMPFVTAYETKYKRKENYNEIAAMFRGKNRLTGKDLAALIHTLFEMSEEIYEYYRELRDLFKAVVKEKIKELPNSSENMEIGYSILKACNMGVLQTEKYREYGELAGKTIVGNDDDTCLGITQMLKAQYLILKKQEE